MIQEERWRHLEPIPLLLYIVRSDDERSRCDQGVLGDALNDTGSRQTSLGVMVPALFHGVANGVQTLGD